MYKACSNCGASRGTLGYERGNKYCTTCQEYETEAEQQEQQIANLKAQVAIERQAKIDNYKHGVKVGEQLKEQHVEIKELKAQVAELEADRQDWVQKALKSKADCIGFQLQIKDLKAQVEALEEWKTIARVMVYAHENCEPRALAEAIEKAKAKESE